MRNNYNHVFGFIQIHPHVHIITLFNALNDLPGPTSDWQPLRYGGGGDGGGGRRETTASMQNTQAKYYIA